MDVVYYVIIPIITSLLGGIVGGLFTFLGVKMTITHEKKLHEEDNKLRKEEQHKKEIERNLLCNKKIIQTKPELKITNDNSDFKTVEEFCLLPYINPELLDEKLILFNYSDEIFKEEFWDKYEIILQNTGKRIIESSFFHIPYKSYVNIYRKKELLDWRYEYIRNYYSDERSIFSYIHPNEKIKIIIYFPKSSPKLEDFGFDLYIRDEDDNYWYQHCVNGNGENEAQITSPDTFYMHKKQDYNYWFIYDSFYYSKDIKKCFTKNLNNLLLERKKANWNKIKEQDKFIHDINKGEKTLNYKLPLE